MSRTLSFELTGGPYAVTAARLALSELDEVVDEALAFDVRLLVSELVTNSVRHAAVGPDDSIQLTVEAEGGRVRVDVVDNGPGFEAPNETADAEAARESGWGLFFVTQLADRWGVVRDEGRVWFEIEREGADAGEQTAA